ncbi:molybdopterin-synthase adenylyltransferase MoeB [Telmatospirillum sp. J64-1]|uniref:HesA/MoeB/ThiF family protein n=1 Tax=Telmatospirillum sp. J64-1 TaxID=2502183 RepID=UPI0021068546|nr:molybdopterin-synthase adenylyltransferase MoeB [Telmatospirillum sp. J64-1]
MNDEQFHRYARNMILDEVGEEGQEKLLASSALIIGMGGLGSPVALYLAAAGVGRLGLVDDDVVDLTNLQRQIAHTTERLGQPKVASAATALAALNPGITVETHPTRLTPENAAALVGAYDIVVDGSDNFDTRYLLNDICLEQGKTLVSGALLRFDGQLTTLRPGRHLDDGRRAPCYRCIFPTPPDPDTVPRCAQAGIFGAVAGVIGTLQAVEVLKELLGLGESMAGRLLLYEGKEASFNTIKLGWNPACPACGEGK